MGPNGNQWNLKRNCGDWWNLICQRNLTLDNDMFKQKGARYRKKNVYTTAVWVK